MCYTNADAAELQKSQGAALSHLLTCCFSLAVLFVPFLRAGHDMHVQHYVCNTMCATLIKILLCGQKSEDAARLPRHYMHVLHKSRRNSFAKEPSFGALLQNKVLFLAVVYSCIHLLTSFLSSNVLKKDQTRATHISTLLFCKRDISTLLFCKRDLARCSFAKETHISTLLFCKRDFFPFVQCTEKRANACNTH